MWVRSALRVTTMLLTAGILLLEYGPAVAQGQVNLGRDVGIDQKLDTALPLETPFVDENGNNVKLADYFGKKKPVILILPFYRCTGSCLLEMDGLVKCMNQLSFALGKEYEVLTVSIHPMEGPEQARAKKKEYLGLYKRANPQNENAWHFLTGSWDSIQTLTKAVGFRFVWDRQKNDIAHATGIIVLTPQGKTSRYFYGVNFSPSNVKLALMEASENKIGSLVDKVVFYCSTFDMVKGRYTANIMRLTQVMGVATVLLVGLFITLLSVQNRRVPLRAAPTGVLPRPGDAPSQE
jgi:protein SCO1/2